MLPIFLGIIGITFASTVGTSITTVDLTTSENVLIGGTLNLTGLATFLDGLDVAGNADVAGNTTLSNLTVSGTATFSGTDDRITSLTGTNYLDMNDGGTITYGSDVLNNTVSTIVGLPKYQYIKMYMSDEKTNYGLPHDKWGTFTRNAISVSSCDTGTDAFTTASAHGLSVGQPIKLTTTNMCGLLTSTNYTICTVPDTTHFTVTDDINGVGTDCSNGGGAIITLTSTEVSGEFTLYPDTIILPVPTAIGYVTCASQTANDDAYFSIPFFSDGSVGTEAFDTGTNVYQAVTNCTGINNNSVCIYNAGSTTNIVTDNNGYIDMICTVVYD